MRKRHTSWAVAALAAGLSFPGCGKQDDQAGAQALTRTARSRPNIVLISVDTLRADHLGCYGYERKTSPRIDQLAAQGALFENAISSTSWTLPAHCALFTGLADSVHGCLEENQRLDDSRVTLAERLKAVGYGTVGFFSGPFCHPVFGVAQGFDEYTDCTSFAEFSLKLLKAGRPLPAGTLRRAAADITNPHVHQQVQTWLRHDHQRPFFMFVHMWDVHADYIPPPPYDRMFDPDYDGPVTGQNVFRDESINAQMPKRDIEHLIALYDGEIAWTDAHVGKILDELDAQALRDSTIVVLLSDHGEEFFEHGDKDHRKTLYDEVIRIPLIIRYPRRIPPGLRFSVQARMVDVLPTILELAGLPLATDVMGQSLVPLFSGGPLAGDTLAISELFSVGRQLRSFRRLERKLIRSERSGRAVAFNLLTDPGEQSPLSSADTSLAQLLVQDVRLASKWLADFRRIVGPPRSSSPQLPDSVRRQLESLGYIDGADEDQGEDKDEEPP